MMINLFERDQICIRKSTKIEIIVFNSDYALCRGLETFR